MRKIAFFIGSLQKGGAERVFVNLADFFSQSGYEVTIVTQYKRENEYAYSEGIHREYSELSEKELTGSRIRNFFRRFKKLRRIWKRVRPDLILSCIGKNNFMAVATSFFMPQKVVVSVVGAPAEEYYTGAMRFLAKTLFLKADGIVLQTTDAGNFFPGYIRKKAVILQNSLNPIFIRKRFEGVRDKLIVAVGRLDDNKNHAMLIKAFSKIRNEFPEYKLVIYGEGESREKLETLVREQNLTDKVSLPGITADVAGSIERAALFVLSSNTEGMPNALIEAMALGLTVISTDCPCGGPKELITPGENGLLIPVGDADALAAAMRQVLGDPELAEKMGKNAALLQERMSPEVTNQSWKEYFEKVMKVMP